MRNRGQVVCAWAGPVGMILFFNGLMLAGFLPPPSPRMPAGEVVAFYQSHAFGIRLCALLGTYAAGCMAIFFGAISAQMRRIEGEVVPLTYAQIGLGAIINAAFLVPSILWSVAAFRPDRAPDVLYMFSDFSWMLLVLPSAGVLQMFVIALAILDDTSASPVFPRWLGYLNIWTGLLTIPGCMIMFFQSGPFAWNGLFGFWAAAIAFGIWVWAMFWGLLKAARKS